jgi:protein-arginine kinase activator protein McsA
MTDFPVLTSLSGAPYVLDQCPVCKTKKEYVEQNDYVGCPSCYSAFGWIITNKLKPSIAEKKKESMDAML